jgi:neogenin
LLSGNKSPPNKTSKLAISSDYLERLNDNQASESEDDYDDDDEGSIHPISSGIDPNVLLHTLTHSQKQHQSFSDEISHFSNSHINPITRKNPPADNLKPSSVSLPGPPRVVQAAVIKPRYITLSWSEPVENPDEVMSYTVFYKMNTNEAR